MYKSQSSFFALLSFAVCSPTVKTGTCMAARSTAPMKCRHGLLIDNVRKAMVQLRDHMRHKAGFQRLRPSSSSSRSLLRRRLSCPIPKMEVCKPTNQRSSPPRLRRLPGVLKVSTWHIFCAVLLRVSFTMKQASLIAPISKGGCSS